MAIFKKGKERKANEAAAKLKSEMEARKIAEIQAKNKTRRTISELNVSLKKMQPGKEKAIEAAKKAYAVGDKKNYNLARNNLKFAIANEKKLQSMLMTFDIMMNMQDTQKMANEFVKGVATISEQILQLAPDEAFEQSQLTIEKAMIANMTQSENLENMLNGMGSNFESMTFDVAGVSDEEIDKMISSQVGDSENVGSINVDSDLEKINAMMG